MALYQFAIIDPLPQDRIQINPGSAIVVPFNLLVGSRLHLDLIQADRGGRIQDFSIRAWISDTPMANPDPSLPSFVQTWQPNKVANTMVVCVFDADTQFGDKVYSIPSSAGSHFINVLNLTNQPNYVYLTITNPNAN